MLSRQETLTIKGDWNHTLPYVKLEVEGVLIRFLVDTGCTLSMINREHLEKLGYRESDLERDDAEDEQSAVLLGRMWLSVAINSFETIRYFGVIDDSENLLGRDFLADYCCVVDLYAGRLTLREYAEDALPLDVIRTTVNIEGKDVEMIVDTGSEHVLTGSLSLAQELDLPLVPSDDMLIDGFGFQGMVPYVAKGLCVRAFGREMRDCTYYVWPEETPEDGRVPLLGVDFLMGMELHFNRDG